jgi:hypothetical protein
MVEPGGDVNSLRRRLLRRLPSGTAHLWYVPAALLAAAVPAVCTLTWLPSVADAGLLGAALRSWTSWGSQGSPCVACGSRVWPSPARCSRIQTGPISSVTIAPVVRLC